MAILQPCAEVILEAKTAWSERCLGEVSKTVDEDLHVVYFGLKQIVWQEILVSDTNVDCQMYFTGEEQQSQLTAGIKRVSSTSEPGGRSSIGNVQEHNRDMD
jgi:hypothetical protein